VTWRQADLEVVCQHNDLRADFAPGDREIESGPVIALEVRQSLVSSLVLVPAGNDEGAARGVTQFGDES
jgi:hypothetical protein